MDTFRGVSHANNVAVKLQIPIFLYLKLKLIELQRAKKVMFDSRRLVYFSIGLVNSVFNLPDGQVMFFEEVK